MSVNIFNKTDGSLTNVSGGSGSSLEFTGTSAEWDALTEEQKAKYDGKIVNITNDYSDLSEIFSAWEDITADCTVEFGGESSGSAKTNYVIYNKYLRKYRYKGTFTIGHNVGRTIRLTDTKNRASMINSFIAGNVNLLSTASAAGQEFGTYRKNGDNVTVTFYNRNSSIDWGNCELFFEIDCSQKIKGGA